jgi:hypothetical protein
LSSASHRNYAKGELVQRGSSLVNLAEVDITIELLIGFQARHPT